MRKLLTLLLVAAMVLGMVGTAFAAAPKDVAGNKYEAAILKLAALGVMTGDDAGWRPSDTIKRSEFAKVMVYALGLQDAAAALAGTPTKFTDVPASHWAAGFVNVAYAQGIIKGTSDTTFSPDSPLTHAEVVTMIVRALGRETEAKNDYPTGYIMVGSQNGLMKNITFVKSQPVLRSEVAAYLNNTLEKPIMQVNKDGLLEDSHKTMLGNLDNTSVTGAVTKVDTANSKIYVDSVAYPVDANALFAGPALKDLTGNNVKIIISGSNDKVIFVGLTDTTQVAGLVTDFSVADGTITVNDKEYTVTDEAVVTVNGVEVLGDAAVKVVELEDANVTLVLNADGEATRVTAYIFDVDGSYIDAKQTVYVDGSSLNQVKVDGTWYTVKSSSTVIRNGAAADYAALAIGDEVKISISSTTNNVVKTIDAYAMTVTGKVKTYALTPDARAITLEVAGKDVVYGAAYDEDDELVTPGIFEGITVGTDAKLTLNRDGKVVTCDQVSSVIPNTVKAIASISHTIDSTGAEIESFTLSDGSSYRMNTGSYTIIRNGVSADLDEVKAGDLLSYMGPLTSSKVSYMTVVSPKLSSWTLTDTTSDPKGTVTNSDGDTVDFYINDATRYSVNGVYATKTEAFDENNYTATVTFNGKMGVLENVPGTLANGVHTYNAGAKTVQLLGGTDALVTANLASGVWLKVGNEVRRITAFASPTATLDSAFTTAPADHTTYSIVTPLVATSIDDVLYTVANGHITAKWSDADYNYITVVHEDDTAYNFAINADSKITVGGVAKGYADLAIGQLVSVAATSDDVVVAADAKVDTTASKNAIQVTQAGDITGGDDAVFTVIAKEDSFVTVKVFDGNHLIAALDEQYVAGGDYYATGTVDTYVAGGPTVKFKTGASSTVDYTGMYLMIGGEAIEITAYDASTKTATLDSAFAVAPVAGQAYAIGGDPTTFTWNLEDDDDNAVVDITSDHTYRVVVYSYDYAGNNATPVEITTTVAK